MTKDLKSLVQEIQKVASPPPPPPAGGPVSAPKVPASPAPSSGAVPVRHGNPGIAKMQEALIALSRDVISQISDKNDSFVDFLTKHFMRNASVPAVEFTPDPTKTKMPEKDPRAASKMSWVMDTMRRIGGTANTASEFKADGVWGPKTAAALQNVYAMTSGLFALADAFGVHPQAYTPENLADLKIGVEKSEEFPLTTKIEYAPEIVKHLNSIRKMYQEVKSQVLQNPHYKTYIDHDTPYLQHAKPETGFTPTPEQLEVMRKVFPNGFSIYLDTTDKGTKVSAKLAVDDLTTPEKFQEWMRSRGVEKDAAEVLKQVADQVGSA